MMACRECSKEISEKAAACPGCGAKVPKPKTWLWVILTIVVCFFGYALTAGNSPEAREKAQKRSAIELCWSEQARKSNGAGEAQFIAGACERMERDFEGQYGHKP